MDGLAVVLDELDGAAVRAINGLIGELDGNAVVEAPDGLATVGAFDGLAVGGELD